MPARPGKVASGLGGAKAANFSGLNLSGFILLERFIPGYRVPALFFLGVKRAWEPSTPPIPVFPCCPVPGNLVG